MDPFGGKISQKLVFKLVLLFQGQQFSNMVFATINDSPIVDSTHQAEQHINFESVPIVEIPQTVAAEYEKPKTTCQYFCVPTLEELEERIRKHSEETFSHFVVAKKTKDFGTPGTSDFSFFKNLQNV